MNKDKDKIDFSDLDAVADFLENEAPSETSLKQSQISKERYYNPDYKKKWLDRNNKRLEDPEYLKKISEVQKKWHKDNPNVRKEIAQTKHWQEAHSKGIRAHIDSPDYVNPRGMLGKKRTEEAKLKTAIANSGKAKPLEGNKKVSIAMKGKKTSAKTKQKLRNINLGKTTDRTRGVNTSVKNFTKLSDAAKYFDVAPESIKNWCNKKGKTIRYSSTRKKLKDKGIQFNENNYPIGFEWAEGHENLGARKVHTDKGIFNNSNEAGKAYGIGGGSIGYRCRSDKWPDFYYLDEKSEFKSNQLN